MVINRPQQIIILTIFVLINLVVGNHDFTNNIDEILKDYESKNGIEIARDEEIMNQLNIDGLDPEIVLDSFLLTPGLIERRGYPCENHTLISDDGYILEIHRIPGSLKSPPRPGKQPVFLMHGLVDSSATWVLMGPQQGLGYMLADLGYDVWMGNARGSRYSRKHVRDDPDGWRGNRRRFWSFSWHEIGLFDLPNMMDYVTQKTGFQRMHYIGHSQGSTAFFVLCSRRPEYNNRIISMHALAPVSYSSHLKSPFFRAAVLGLNSLDMATSILGVYEFLPNSYILGLLGQAVCRDETIFQFICSNVLFLIAGYNADQMNTTMLPVVMGHTPAGASTDQLIHYGQLIRSGHFRQYDYGMVANLIEYGSVKPPKYDLRQIKAPVALHYSQNDWLADVKDVNQLSSELGNVIGSFLVPHKKFNHLDFLWAIDARTLVYNKVVDIMKLYQGKQSDVNLNFNNDINDVV